MHATHGNNVVLAFLSCPYSRLDCAEKIEQEFVPSQVEKISQSEEGLPELVERKIQIQLPIRQTQLAS